jgi:isopenicillin N synthase-like dioxygenase
VTGDAILDIDVAAYEQGDGLRRRATIDGVRRTLMTGFVYARHSIPADVMDSAYAGLEKFFSLPQEMKDRY